MKFPDLGDRYRIKCSLGAGGMGEVFLARDQKLGRLVAIKRLTPRQEGRDRRRKRFHLEARIAARLKDPAVVQVYDVHQDEDTDYIAMEYVDGTTLHARIQHGPPLTLGQVLRLGRRIAAGMAAIHACDIIHRDLKSENVLIDRAGNVKITDFGIAKVLGEESLTEDGLVAGTYKAMSPEQARGARLDPRTDLFSFGILLYEALTGTLPFTGETSTEIIEAILGSDPPSLEERRPGLPPALINLIGQLLQKSRDLRPPGGFTEVEAVLAEIAAEVGDEDDGLAAPDVLARDDEETHSVESPTPAPAPGDTPFLETEAAATPDAPAQEVTTKQLPASASQSSDPPPRRRWPAIAGLGALVLVAVVYAVRSWLAPPVPHVNIAVGEPHLSGCTDADMEHARTARHAITGALIGLEDVSVLPRERPGASAPVHRYSPTLVDPDETLSISITCLSNRITIEIQRLDKRGALIDQSLRFPVDHSEIGRSDTVFHNNIQRLFPSRFRHEFYPEDVDRFLRLQEAYWRKDPEFPTERILGELDRIRERSPGLVDAYRFEAELWNHKYVVSRKERHYQQARTLLARAHELAPSSQLVLSGIISLALDHGDLEEAEQVLAELKDLVPGSGLTLYLHALILSEHGEKQAARDLMNEAMERRPSWRILYHLAKLEVDLDQIDTARKHLAQLLEKYPDNRAGEALDLFLDLFVDQDLRSCEQIDPKNASKVNDCAVARMDLGQYTAAILLLERARAMHPWHLDIAFNLGEALELTGDPKRAATAFQEVFEIWRNIDPDDMTPHQFAIGALTLAHLHRQEEARQAIETALTRVARTPNEVHIHYAAAATYALLQDTEKTVDYILSIPTKDYGPTTFLYPWFDFVRDDPRLRTRLALASAAKNPE